MTDSKQLATQDSAAMLERLVVDGDLSKLTAEQKVRHYIATCESLNLNWRTQPFAYLRLNGKEVLYAKRDCTDQLRKANAVSIISLERDRMDDLYVVTATARTPDGRTDSAIGAVPLGALKGEPLANAIMKAETKAKRRVTLSICGLGMSDDETEVDSIPGARVVEPDVLPATVERNGQTINTGSGEIVDPPQADTKVKKQRPIEEYANKYIELTEEAKRWNSDESHETIEYRAYDQNWTREEIRQAGVDLAMQLDRVKKAPNPTPAPITEDELASLPF